MASGILCFCLFLMAINSAVGLKCYSCDSSKGVNCNFGLLSFSYDTLDCSDSTKTGSGFLDSLTSIIPNNCVKIVGIEQDGTEYIARGCSVSTGPINTCQVIAKTIQFADSKDLKSLDCYTCNTDKCNSATRFTGMTVVGLILAIFITVF